MRIPHLVKDGKKFCTMCKRTLPFKVFYKKKGTKSGLTSNCKKCIKEYNSNRRPKPGKLYWRKKDLRKNYGLTLEQYDEMFEKQNGVCAICNQINITGRRLAVDHNHKTGKIRGLLCSTCNMKLGIVEDNIFVTRAKKYLNR